MATSAELLRLAAKALDDGEDPLSPYFLGQHDVTFDQCISLAGSLAIGARIVATGIEEPRSAQGVAWALTIADRKSVV